MEKNSSETDDSETSQRDKFKIFGLFFENSLALLTAIGWCTYSLFESPNFFRLITFLPDDVLLQFWGETT